MTEGDFLDEPSGKAERSTTLEMTEGDFLDKPSGKAERSTTLEMTEGDFSTMLEMTYV